MEDSPSESTSRSGAPRPATRFDRFASMTPPADDTAVYPTDDTHGFFAKGRDFEGININHQYTKEEKRLLGTYDSLDYLPSHSTAYRNWLKRQPSRLDWDRWVMMGLIGFTVGIVGFFVHQLIDVISEVKWRKADEYVKENKFAIAWAWAFVYSVGFVLFGTFIVVFIRPSAAGSGLPELIGFLNGTLVRHIFNIKTFVVKLLSCCAVVGAGMPCGPEGPMIHMGSLIGAGVSQFKSETLKLKLPFFSRFRNSEDRRNFISAGAAAGVASAFGAPVGGLLFSMEEVSSFWNLRLCWQIFFCAMVSTFTTDLFNSAFNGFRYIGSFGTFRSNNYIIFQVNPFISVNILAFIPSVILGIIGGLLGSAFNFVNLKIARARKKTLSLIRSHKLQCVVRMIEPPIIMTLMVTVTVMLPSAFKCTPFTCIYEGNTISKDCMNSTVSALRVQPTVATYTCPIGEEIDMGNHTYTNSTFNEVATLLFGSGEEAIHQLFSRGTHLQFGYASMSVTLVIYLILACWAAGTSMSSGIVVPMLFIGGLYGRLLGRAMVDLFGVHVDEDSYWNWIDPGVFALIGAASFFGGVSRLTVSLTVIMMEITNDVQFLLPIMASVMVAKWVGDQITHPLYHALLELKCIPYLSSEPVILHQSTTYVNLEMFTANDIMTRAVRTLRVKESVSQIANLLLITNHGGFPVVKTQPSGKSTFFGTITRMELIILLKHEDIFFDMAHADERLADEDITDIDYEQVTVEVLSDPEAMEEMLTNICVDTKYQDLFIDLAPYANQSAVSLPSKFSLHRTYIIFRTLGLRHITVTDPENRVVGIITRKDLMGFNMEEKLSGQIESTLQERQPSTEEDHREDQDHLDRHQTLATGSNIRHSAQLSSPQRAQTFSVADSDHANLIV